MSGRRRSGEEHGAAPGAPAATNPALGLRFDLQRVRPMAEDPCINADPGPPEAQPPEVDVAAAAQGLRAFTHRLLDAAAHVIERRHPEFVANLRALTEGNRLELSEALEAPPGSTQTFRDYRTLLTLVFDLELGLHQLRTALRLMGVQLHPDILATLRMGDGEWWYYRYTMWSVTVFAVIDRAKALVTTAMRRLRRRYDPDRWQAAQQPLLETLAALKEKAGELRHPLAHGAFSGGGSGPVQGIAEAGLWEQLAALRLWIAPEYTLDPFAEPQAQARWQRQAFQTSVIAVAHVERIMELLTAAIDWERVKGKG